ncbi:hypothetical protein IFM89_036641, partial [Coptis chinensis]
HEIVGIVTEVGNKVTKFKVGDKVGVGCLVGACHSCDNCNKSLENYCPKMIFTYGGLYYDETMTYGGYSDSMVANEHYAVRIPDNLPLDASGLENVAVKFAKAFGAKVTVISTSPAKKKEATKHLGADSFLVSRDQEQMQKSNDRKYASYLEIDAASGLSILLSSKGKSSTQFYFGAGS